MQNSGFHHVAFACRDLDATVAFYQATMFDYVHTQPSSNCITTSKNSEKNKARPSKGGFCFFTFSLEF